MSDNTEGYMIKHESCSYLIPLLIPTHPYHTVLPQVISLNSVAW